ncbi:MAG: protein kinase [Deltaproteobacteria bacterium]|nr:protein kinase [Deltaproteobacteria bacterium]
MVPSGPTGSERMDGASRTHEDSLAGRYRLGRVIARGGSGVVYAAHDERVGSEVAVKVLRRALASDTTAVARMVREVELVARLKHPNVVRVIDVGTERDQPFLVMELLEGRTLAERVEADGPLAIERVRTIAAQLLDALDAVHRAGVLHRDLKPANVFLVPVRRGELVKLLDFGHGVLHDGSSAKLTESGFFAGTPGYIAPERLLGAAHDARSDVYGAAVCLYEALTGKPAFHAPSPLALHAAIVHGRWEPIAALRPEAPLALVTAIERAMHVDPARRFASASELAESIEDALAPLAHGAVDPHARTLPVASSVDRRHAPRTTEPAATPRRRRDTAHALRIGLVLLAVSAAGAWWLSRASGATDPPSDHESAEPREALAEASQVPAEASQVPAEPSPVPAEASHLSADTSAVTAPVPAPAITTHTDREPSDRDPRTSSRDRADPEETTPRAPRARAVTGAESATREEPRPEAPPPTEAAAPSEATAPTEAPAPNEATPSRADEMFVPSWAR